MTGDLRAIAARLDGEVIGGQILAPGPGHGPRDRSMSIKFSNDGSFIVSSFAGDDWRACRDLVKDRLGMQSTCQIDKLGKFPKSRANIEKTNKNGPFALKLFDQSAPIYGTLGERYLIEHRNLDVRGLDLYHAVRYHAGIRAVVGLMSDPVTGEATGVHRIFLKSDGSKISRKMLGHEGVVRLSQDAEVTYGLGISDSIEDALAVLISGWRPIWACTADGGVARFPVLSGIDALTIFPDGDEPGMKAANTCAARWREAGREVVIVAPKGGSHE